MAKIVTRTEYLVCYDVNTEDLAGRRRLRRVAKICESYGQRVQMSVFEISVTEALYAKMMTKLCEVINTKEDSLRVYRLVSPREAGTFVVGRDLYVDFSEPQIL